MIPGRIVPAVAGLAFLGLGGASAGGTAVEASTAGLSPALRVENAAQVIAAADGSAVLLASPGTAVLAIVAGAITREDAAVRIDGEGEDAGITAVYVPLNDATRSAQVARGDEVGRVPPPATAASDHPPGGGAPESRAATRVTVSLRVDGHLIDAAPLLQAAVDDPAGAAGRGTIVRPLVGAVVSQEFGCTAYTFEPVAPACPGGHFHSGIDLAAPFGTPVQAALGGTVHVIDTTTGYGLHVTVDAGGGVVTLYAHLASVLVADGDQVSTGGVIGTVGSTGNSTGPHLHFEVRHDNLPEDPRHDVALP